MPQDTQSQTDNISKSLTMKIINRTLNEMGFNKKTNPEDTWWDKYIEIETYDPKVSLHLSKPTRPSESRSLLSSFQIAATVQVLQSFIYPAYFDIIEARFQQRYEDLKKHYTGKDPEAKFVKDTARAIKAFLYRQIELEQEKMDGLAEAALAPENFSKKVVFRHKHTRIYYFFVVLFMLSVIVSIAAFFYTLGPLVNTESDDKSYAGIVSQVIGYAALIILCCVLSCCGLKVKKHTKIPAARILGVLDLEVKDLPVERNEEEDKEEEEKDDEKEEKRAPNLEVKLKSLFPSIDDALPFPWALVQQMINPAKIMSIFNPANMGGEMPLPIPLEITLFIFEDKEICDAILKDAGINLTAEEYLEPPEPETVKKIMDEGPAYMSMPTGDGESVIVHLDSKSDIGSKGPNPAEIEEKKHPKEIELTNIAREKAKEEAKEDAKEEAKTEWTDEDEDSVRSIVTTAFQQSIKAEQKGSTSFFEAPLATAISKVRQISNLTDDTETTGLLSGKDD